MSFDEPMLTSGTAADQLGISTSGLRRLASIYENVHGELPRTRERGPILWPQVAVRRLAAAREMFGNGKAASIEDALDRLGDRSDLPAVGVAQEQQGVASGVLLEELRALRSEVRELRDELSRVRKELPPSTTKTAATEEELPPWLRWVAEQYSKWKQSF